MRRLPARQRDVDRAGRPGGRRRRLEPFREAGLDLLFQLVGQLAEARTLLGRGRAQRLQQRRDEAALPGQVPVADDAELGLAEGCGNVPFELGAEIVDLAGGIAHEWRAVVNGAAAASLPQQENR